VFVLAHFAVLWFAYPEALGSMNPLEAPLHMTAGRGALVLFLVITVTSQWRKQLRIDYDYWRFAHSVLAVIAVVLAIVHVDGVGYYIAGPWMRPLWIGYSAFWVLLIVHIRVIKPVRLLSKPYHVVENIDERGQAKTLTLAPDGHDGVRFKPGQFAWLTIGSKPHRFREHPFSFSGSAEAADGRVSFTIKALGDFTGTVDEFRAGDTAFVDGPYGVFTLDRYPDAPGALFIAAGVGITPIMSMLRTLADRRDRRPFTLVYANPKWDDVIFRDELATLPERLNLKIVHVLEEPPDDWDGAEGLITRELLESLLPEHAANFEYFVCGPKPVCDSAYEWLRANRIPAQRIHFELFDMV
jgi:predicted ferric reductase